MSTLNVKHENIEVNGIKLHIIARQGSVKN